MSAKLTTFLGAGTASLWEIKFPLMFRSLVVELEQEAASFTDFACSMLTPFTGLKAQIVARDGTPFFRLNVLRMYESNCQDLSQLGQVISNVAMTAFDAFFEHLPIGARITLMPPAGGVVLPRLRIQYTTSDGPVSVTRIGPSKILLSTSAQEISFDLNTLPANIRLRTISIPGVGDAEFLLTQSSSLFDEAYSPEILTEVEDPSKFARAMSRSLELIDSTVPDLSARLGRRVRWYVPIKSLNRNTHCSFSSGRLSGVLFLSESHDPLRLAEAIVHEFGHTELNILMDVENLLVDEEQKLYYSPWRDDARPLEGLFHALYVFSEVVQFLLRLRECPLECDPNIIHQRLHIIGHRLRIGLAQVPQAQIAAPGQEILDEVRDTLRMLITGGYLEGDMPRLIQDHLDSWRRRYPQFASAVVLPKEGAGLF